MSSSIAKELKSPLHNATIASVLRALAGSLFHKFGFFMDCLRKRYASQTSRSICKSTWRNISQNVNPRESWLKQGS